MYAYSLIQGNRMARIYFSSNSEIRSVLSLVNVETARPALNSSARFNFGLVGVCMPWNEHGHHDVMRTSPLLTPPASWPAGLCLPAHLSLKMNDCWVAIAYQIKSPQLLILVKIAACQVHVTVLLDSLGILKIWPSQKSPTWVADFYVA